MNRPPITEEALDEARQGFYASMQALDQRITEEPRPEASL